MDTKKILRSVYSFIPIVLILVLTDQITNLFIKLVIAVVIVILFEIPKIIARHTKKN